MWPVWDYPALCQGREVAHPEPDWDRERGQTPHLTGRGQAGRSWVGLSVQDLVSYWQPLACVSVCVCFSPKLGAPLGLLENCCPHFYHLYCLVLRNVFLLWRPWLSLSPYHSAQAQRGSKYAGEGEACSEHLLFKAPYWGFLHSPSPIWGVSRDGAQCVCGVSIRCA